MQPARIAIYGIGNVLANDDGFGPWFVQRFAHEFDLPENVIVEDLGAPGLDLASRIVDLDLLILVDIVRIAGEPGTLHVFSREDLLAAALVAQPLSRHEIGLPDALSLAELVGRPPERVALVAAIPESTQMGTQLSPPVEAAYAAARATVLTLLNEAGVTLQPATATAPDPTDAAHPLFTRDAAYLATV